MVTHRCQQTDQPNVGLGAVQVGRRVVRGFSGDCFRYASLELCMFQGMGFFRRVLRDSSVHRSVTQQREPVRLILPSKCCDLQQRPLTMIGRQDVMQAQSSALNSVDCFREPGTLVPVVGSPSLKLLASCGFTEEVQATDWGSNPLTF